MPERNAVRRPFRHLHEIAGTDVAQEFNAPFADPDVTAMQFDRVRAALGLRS